MQKYVYKSFLRCRCVSFNRFKTELSCQTSFELSVDRISTILPAKTHNKSHGMRELSICSTRWQLGAQAHSQSAQWPCVRLSLCSVYGCPCSRDERRTQYSVLLNCWAVMYTYLALACFVIGQSRRYFQHSQLIFDPVWIALDK
jgi:hypothetical protein